MKWFDKEDSKPKVVFVDNHLLVIDKPAGLLTQPDETDRPSVEAWGKEWIRQKYQKPGNVFLHAVHRLDRPVRGLVLFARTSKALSRLNEQVRGQKIERIYVAEVEGDLRETAGTLEHFLVHDEHRASLARDGEGKKGRLTFRKLGKSARGTLVEIALETGRYHQIRAQFAAAGHPIVGDARYGGEPLSKGEEGIHLCSAKLAFTHPTTGERLEFSCG